MISGSEIKYEHKPPVSDKKTDKKSVRKSKNRMSRPVIDQKRCEKNYSCYVFCPKDAIEINESGSPSVNLELCDGCLICLRKCPFVAIGEENER